MAFLPELGRSALRGRMWGMETISTLRQAVLWPRDLSPVVPEACGDGDDVIVLIHGFFASAGAFRPMRARIERETGAHVASFTHAPGQSVRTIARKLARVVDRLPSTSRVHIVGHSLGGIVARWYVQELGGHARVTQTISMASPFGGAPLARKLPYFVGRDLLGDSATLVRLRTSPHAARVPHTSIIAGEDHIVVPRESGAFHLGEVVVLTGRSHNSLLFDREVVRIVAARVAAHRPATPLAKTG
jgi:triacylglycerol lipase